MYVAGSHTQYGHSVVPTRSLRTEILAIPESRVPVVTDLECLLPLPTVLMLSLNMMDGEDSHGIGCCDWRMQADTPHRALTWTTGGMSMTF